MDETRPAPLILVVDDERHIIRQCEETLQAAGCATAHAYDGAQAMEWLEQNPPPNLIVLDIFMPRMQGFEMLERLRKESRFDSVRVVILTAPSAEAVEESYWDKHVKWLRGLGVDTWLYKPFPPADLIATVAWNLSDRTGPAPETSQLSPDEEHARRRLRLFGPF